MRNDDLLQIVIEDPASTHASKCSTAVSALPRQLGLIGSLELLYDEYHRQALWLAYRILRDVGDAEDVVQEAFLSAWRFSRSYDGQKGSTKTWLLAMVRNRSIDLLRSRRRRPVSTLDEGADLVGVEDPAGDAMSRVEGQIACKAVAALPEPQRRVVEMIYFEGMSHNDVAQLLSTPVGTIKSRMRLALHRLRTVLADGERSPSLC